MRVIRAQPGDAGRLLVLTNGQQTRLYELVIGKPGKLSAQLQEVKPPQRDMVLREVNRRSE